MAEYLDKVQDALPTAIKRTIKQGKATKKLMDDNKAKILAEDKAHGATGGAIWRGAIDPEFKKKYMEDKARAEAEAKGKGLIAGYKTEADSGLTHIYPISHAHILEILKHLA